MAFKQAMCLWVKPDFSAAHAGQMEPPRVNHSKVDFGRLKGALEATFRSGPKVSIQVANDTIDQVTFHFRLHASPDSNFEDFGAVLVTTAHSQTSDVVDVRSAWCALHALPNRDYAPPPIGIAFVITAADFEGAQEWAADTRPVLGLRPFDPLDLSLPPEDEEGKLPEPLKVALQSIFGVGFEDFAILRRLASDDLPEWAAKGMEELKKGDARENPGKASPEGDSGGLSLSRIFETAGEASRMLRELEGLEDDGRIFHGAPEDMKAGIEGFIEMATGKRMDADDFFNQVRLSGGLQGPSAPAWFDLLSNLGWQLESWQEDAPRFSPAFVAIGRGGDVELPVICENYPFAPGDDGDVLAREAKKAVAERFPEGAILTFKTMFSMDFEGQRYSCGGLYLTRHQWRPFALSAAMGSLDSLLDQVKERFSFNAPAPKYADGGLGVAIALNRMTHGKDPNDHEQQMISISSGTWYSVIPDSVL